MFISFRFEAKRKDRKLIEAKQKMFGSEIKQKYALLISLWSEAKNSKRNKAKRSEKKNFVFHVTVRNACKTDLVSLRFALKRKIFFAKPAHPT
jgi:ABC-type transporter MlaC component